MDIFDEFIVVEEKAITDLSAPVKRLNRQRRGVSWGEDFSAKSKLISKFVALEFQCKDGIFSMEINDIGNASADVPLAQVIQWAETTEQFETNILHSGGKTDLSHMEFPLIVIRILKKRVKNTNPCPPLSSPDDELTVHIGDKQITVSAHWLMSVSPVINRMLSVEMREKQQRSLTLNELGVDMEQFMEFLEAVSPTALQTPILPNPKNVLMLLKLADYFQVDWLKSRCEVHLINCVEIPLIDRFFLIDLYQLVNLKNFFMHLGVDKLREFFNANRHQFLPGKAAVSHELLFELTSWLCEGFLAHNY